MEEFAQSQQKIHSDHAKILMIAQYILYFMLFLSKFQEIIIKLIQIFKQRMSYKATVDIFINFSFLQVRLLNKQGYLRYRTKIYMKYQNRQAICHPYNIVKGPTPIRIENGLSQEQGPQIQMDSQIDSDTLYYYSRLIPIISRPGNYEQNQTVFFKAYINTQIIEDIEFYCIIECLFTENPQKCTEMEVVSKFQARIRKIYDISTFLPVIFDAFQGFMIMSTFHATILEFKFSEDDFETLGGGKIQTKGENKDKRKRIQQIRNSCVDLYSYLELITSFKRERLLDFYQYYRQFLSKEIESISSRMKQLVQRVSQQTKTQIKLSESEGIKISIKTNEELITLIQQDISIFANSSKDSASITSAQQKNVIVDMIAKDFSTMKGHLYKKWMEYAKLIINNSKPIAKYYRKQYQVLCKQRFKNNVFSHKIKNHDWRLSKYTDSGKVNLEHAFKQKKKVSTEQQLWKEHFPIENINYFGKSETNIKIFQQIYLTNSEASPQSKYKPKHVIVLVHGFQATRQDFILLKNCLQVVYGVHVMISTCNQGQTEHSIVVAGKRLANQVKKLLVTVNGDFRLSFIGHSMGGLIIRSALPELSHLSHKFYTYLTFSTPHLGYLYQSSALVKVGLWILSSWQKIQALQQLTMKDNPDLRQTVLYKLSKNNSLKQFRKICFVCSSLDEYVSYQSARVQQNPKIIENFDKNTQQVIKEMVNGMIGEVKSPQISRINAVFNIEDKNLDSFLGKAGHVKFLSDIQFIREFCSCFDKFFA